MMQWRLLAGLATATSALCIPAARAGDFGSLPNLAQGEFRKLSEDLGAAASYKGVTPATPLGLLGFDVGLEVTSTRMENSSLFALAGAGNQSDLVIPKLHVYKGLVAGLDIGAFVGGLPDLNASLYGADLRWAFVDDGLATPAVAVRLSGTMTNGLGALDIATAAADLVVSKKFALATPYLGVGTVRVVSEAKGTGLAEEKFNKSRVFTGLNVNLAVINLALEAEKMGDNLSYSAKLGWRF